MRLLNSSTLQFKEFFDSNIPPYQILSHRWGMDEDEVSYQHFISRENTGSSGYQKIENFCHLAEAENCEWVWVDTCCIDKKSSAELSEAINSMYRWYKSAEVCVAFLNDVFSDSDEEEVDPLKDFSPWLESFKRSQWFERGWTLQELLAPGEINFLDRNWRFIGTRSALADHISAITGINVQVCQGVRRIDSFCIAQRMSWAANRKTSRTEDVAYCLLGLFEINMPLLYGEGSKAFLRLQEEIIRSSDDESIFAWISETPTHKGLLAESPKYFARSGNIKILHFHRQNPYTITNRGLQADVALLPAPNKAADHFLIPISCSEGPLSPLAILIQKGLLLNDSYARVACQEIKSFGLTPQAWFFNRDERQVVHIYLRPKL